MISRAKRVMLYVLLEIGIAAVGYGVNLLPSEYTLSATFLILGLILSIIFEILIEETKEEILPVDIIVGERELKNTYKALRDGACEMKAVWCSKYAEVKKYFTEEMDDLKNNPRLTIRRLINPRVIQSSDYQDHLTMTQNSRNSGRYSIKTTELTELEGVVCEYEVKEQREWKALLVLNDINTNTPILGILFDPTKKEKSRPALAAIDSWFDKEWRKGGKI
jgi:hypothetical protein